MRALCKGCTFPFQEKVAVQIRPTRSTLFIKEEMQQKNFDYNALKLEYFKSDIDEIKGFWVAKGLKYNSKVGEHTRGRGQEKQKRKDEIVKKALEKEKNRIANKLEIDPDDLFKTKKQAYELMKVKLNQYTKKINEAKATGEEENVPINMKDLEKIRKVAKVELWEPTIVAKNEWTTTLKTNWPLVEIIRSDEKEEIQDESEEDDE